MTDRGKLSALIEGHDWAATPLGAIGDWSPTLRVAVDLMLATPQPVYIGWGDDLISLYNDGYIPILGSQHPRALGAPYREVCPELWDEFRPVAEAVMAGEAFYFEDRPVALAGRSGQAMSWFTFSWTPLPLADGRVGGFYCIATETSERVLAQRASTRRYRGLFESSPAPLLILKPDTPRFTIADVNGAYLAATMRTREDLIGRGMFEAFPDNPNDPAATGVDNLRASFERALASRRPDMMPVQKYDVARPDGTFEQRWWSPINSVVPGENAEVEAIIHHVSDVTAEHRAEAALRESEAQLTLASEIRGIGHWSLDLATRELTTSAACRRNFGRSADAPFPYETLVASIHPDDRDRQQRAVGAAIEARSSFDIEYRLVTPGGETRWASIRAGYEEGAHPRLVGVSLDITERKRAEEALRASEQRLQLALEATELAVYEWDLVSDRLSANARFREMVGLGPDAPVIGAYIMEHVVHPADRPRIDRDLDRAMGDASTGKFAFEHRLNRTGPHGEPWVLSHGQVFFAGADGDRRPVRVFGTLQDVTERKRSEAAQRESEERQAFVLKLADALRPLADAKEIEATATALLREWFDAGWCYYVEWRSEETVGVVLEDSVREGLPSLSGEHDVSDVPEFMDSLRSGQVLNVPDYAHFGLLSDRIRERYTALGVRAILGAPVVKGGRNVALLLLADTKERQWPETAVALMADVAERIWTTVERSRAEASLRASEARLQQANRTKDQFLAMLGHELRNPLAPIVTTLELMKLRAPDVFVRERASIEAQAALLVDMVDDLLDVARISRGDLKLERKPVAVDRVIDAAAETTATILSAQRQAIEIKVEAGLVVLGDRRRLVQVIINLLVNAAKYSPPDRKISIEGHAQKKNAQIVVRDQGNGIEAELQSRIFEAFTQGEQGPDRRRGGLGLGLAIVHNIVSLHGGTIKVASAGKDAGSEFTLCLPLFREDSAAQNPPPHSAAPARSAAPATGRPTRVLLVDDNVAGAQALGTFLEATGHEVRVEYDGEAALAAAGEWLGDVAVLDIGLPDMDGHALARALRALPQWAERPLIALTGYGQAQDRARTRAAGFDAHLTKPVRPTELVSLIRKLISEKNRDTEAG